MSMKYRLDRLKTVDDQGLQWRVTCLGEKRSRVGESKILKGRSSWEKLSFDFFIPD